MLSVGGGDLEKNISPNLVRGRAARQEGRRDGVRHRRPRRRLHGEGGRRLRHRADGEPGHVTPHAEAFQAVVWHLLVSHPALKAAETKWESTAATRRRRDSRSPLAAVFASELPAVANGSTPRAATTLENHAAARCSSTATASSTGPSPTAATRPPTTSGSSSCCPACRRRRAPGRRRLRAGRRHQPARRGPRHADTRGVEAINATCAANCRCSTCSRATTTAADGCACRKPKPGLLLEAARRAELDLRTAFLVGDRWSDVAAGRRPAAAACWSRRRSAAAERCNPDHTATDLAGPRTGFWPPRAGVDAHPREWIPTGVA